MRCLIFSTAKERHDARDISDWTRKGPLPDLPSQRRGPPRGFDNMSDAGSERGGRRGYEPADNKMRDFNNWERKGPMSPTLAPAAPFGREGRPRTNEGPQFRRASPAWGEGRSQDGSRPPRREFQEREPTASERDNQWRARMRPDAPPPQPAAPAAAPALAVRPKLNLQKRTVQEEVASPSSATSGDSKASPFGAARPIDTAAKEREIEERRQARQKELEEKAKAEKERIAKEREEAKQKEKEQAATAPAATSAAAPSTANKEESEVPHGAKNFEILQRVGESGEVVESEGAEPNKAGEQTAAAPKDAAPSQPSKANGNWRNGNAPRGRNPSYQRGPRNQQAGGPRGQASPAAAPAQQPEEDGWSTVGPKQRSSRRGRQY